MRSKHLNKLFMVMALLAIAAFTLSGCSGGGSATTTTPTSLSSSTTTDTTAATKTQITSISFPSPAAVVGTTVNFTIVDTSGNPVTTLPADISVAFTYAKLTWDSVGNSLWTNYIFAEGAITGTSAVGSGTGNTPAITTPVKQGSTQSAAVTAIVNNGAGKYSYTFTNTKLTSTNFTTPETFDANTINRIGMELSEGGITPVNSVYDIVPNGSTSPVTRKIATTDSCLTCHYSREGFGFHHVAANPAATSGNRKEIEYCVTCHNPGSTDPNSGNTISMDSFIHKLHMGEELPSVAAGGSFIIWGYGGGVHDYSEVAYPQDIRNCSTCHTQSAATPDGDNWNTHPTRRACGSCHDGINFANGTGTTIGGSTAGHVGGAKTDDLMCKSCHAAADIKADHMTIFSTTHNPEVPAGLDNFTYEVASMSVNSSRQAQFTFRINRNGTPVRFNSWVAGNETGMITGQNTFPRAGSGPTFYVMYSLPQDGILAPADYNASFSASVLNVWNGKNGTLAGPDANGWYSATIITNLVPTNASMVDGMLYGTLNQITGGTVIGGNGYLNGTQRVIPAVLVTAKNYTGRRKIVETSRCNKCHEQFGTTMGAGGVPDFHSGEIERNNAQICAVCHTPNRTSSGWSARSSSFIHAIHSANPEGANNSPRTVDYNWHSTTVSSFATVRYPGMLNQCEQCHLPGMYDFSATVYTSTAVLNGSSTPKYQEKVLDRMLYTTVASGTFKSSYTATQQIAWSPYVTRTNTVYGSGYLATAISYGITSMVSTGGDITSPDSRTLVTSPISTVCFSCHDSNADHAHFEANGGAVYSARDQTNAWDRTKPVEGCLLCHGVGKIAPIKDVHKVAAPR